MPARSAYQAARVAGIYVLVSVLWILFSDRAVELWVADPAAMRRVQSIKGLAFVLATGLLLFFLVRAEIRARLRAARRLAGATELLETTFRAMPDAVVVVGFPERGIRAVNPAAVRLFGLGRDELEGRPVAELFETEAHARRFEAASRLALERSEVHRGVFQLRRADGSTFLAEHSVSWVDEGRDDGEPELGVMVLRDVTRRIHDEAELEHAHAELERAHQELARTGEILEHAQAIAGVGAWAFDPRTRRHTWSEQTYRIFGLEPGTEMVLDRFVELVHPDDAERVRRNIEAAAKDEAPLDHRFRIVRPDGEVRRVHGRGEPVRDEEGRPVALHGVIQDITRRRRMERAIRRSRRRARRLAAHLQGAIEEERRNLAREMHDELGGSLTGLRMQLSRLRSRLSETAGMSTTSDAAAAPTEIARKISGEMDELLGEIIGRVRSLSAALRPAVLDDVGLVPAIEWLVERFEERTGVACRLECAADCPLEDLPLSREASIHVFRIVQEALTNAARHAEADRVGVRVGRRDGRLEVTVRDDGRGVSPASLRRRDAFGVQGMRERARLLGGRFRLRPAPEGGTLAELRVPLAGNGAAGDKGRER